ncbi:MAG TPA: beta-galactosidase GalA [Bacteroidales bacterium]|nr:beta-galactosidase GalA [Bacteroidales bacterium]
MKKLTIILSVVVSISFCYALRAQDIQVRERINFDKGWLFALGHSFDASKDFDNGTGYFSYFAKAGYGDGAASANFDDRAWRVLDLPHDWCVELPFSEKGGHSHGYKAIGRNFPENSVGWYRKKFSIPESDLGKRISIEFDGVHRDAIVWVNGFYLGTEHNGYASYAYDITDYLNYGGENVVAVRVDATMEEGWYYEGAGIYRHTWLTKTNPLHVARYGTFITTELSNNNTVAKAVVRTTIVNEAREEQTFSLEDMIVDAENKAITSGSKTNLKLKPGESKCFYSTYTLKNPNLWTLEKPYLHKLLTIVRTNNKVVDTYETNFGVRTVRFDANEGFFLNGKHVKIVGTNCHQDHAGVGTAIPDGLQEYRIKKLKDMGNNGIRTSHNPPTPEMLDACDRLGMLVLDENRLMGCNDEHFKYLKNMMLRDRNHPSVVLWSLGNEEWAIEGNIKGARIAATMQAYAQQLDSSRAFTAALSGGWDTGIGTVTQVMGYNYIVQGNIDEHHKKFPWQAGIGTEESNTVGTRGIYETNDNLCHLAPTNRMPENVGTESGWQFYAARPFLAGLFYWTGFDYRGEPTPYGWPAIASQYGIVDLCGYPKDIFYYLKAWWGKDPVLHIWPHWNWKGKEGQPIKVTVYSNCDEVELFLNNKSLGKQTMPVNGHLEWAVNYEPGVLSAKGYKGGKETLQSKVETTDVEDGIQLTTDKSAISSDPNDISVITVNVTDKNGLVVPTAMNEVAFTIEGEGRIIGVGNGNPSSHEKDKYTETIKLSKNVDLKEFSVVSLENCPQVDPKVDASGWKAAFTTQSKDWKVYTDSLIVVRGTFEIPGFTNETQINLFTKSIVENQSVYVNGRLIKANIKRDAEGQSFVLDHSILKPGKNVFAVTGQRFRKKHQWDEPNTDPGLVQVIIPAEQWKRKVFNGYAQVIVQPTGKTGNIKLSASSAGLKPASLIINVK